MTDTNVQTKVTFKDLIIKHLHSMIDFVETTNLDTIENLDKVDAGLESITKLLEEKAKLIRTEEAFEEFIRQEIRSSFPRHSISDRAKQLRSSAQTGAVTTQQTGEIFSTDKSDVKDNVTHIHQGVPATEPESAEAADDETYALKGDEPKAESKSSTLSFDNIPGLIQSTAKFVGFSVSKINREDLCDLCVTIHNLSDKAFSLSFTGLSGENNSRISTSNFNTVVEGNDSTTVVFQVDPKELEKETTLSVIVIDSVTHGRIEAKASLPAFN